LNDPTLPHPGILILLLQRFTPICIGEDADVIFPLLEGAWRSLGLFSEAEINKHVYRNDCRHAGFTWRQAKPFGWTLQQSPQDEESSGWTAYTGRHPDPDNNSFPFAALNQALANARSSCAQIVRPEWLRWNDGTVPRLARKIYDVADLGMVPILADALEEAGCTHTAILEPCRSASDPARACWIIELLLDLEPGSCIRRYFGPTARRVRQLFRFEITMPSTVNDYQHILELNESLDALGHVWLAAGGDETTLGVRIWNNREEGIRIIRDVLRRLGAPAGTTITGARPSYEAIPLDP
jgi:hypothetical protein